MTYSRTLILSVTGLLAGMVLLSQLSSVMTYVLLAFMAISMMIKISHNHPEKTRQILQFITEFIGFCTVIAMFVTITVIMGSFYS